MTPRPRNYLFRVAVAFNQVVNAILGGNPDATPSTSIHGAAISGIPSCAVAEGLVDGLVGRSRGF